jgi:hypothetical protein
MKDEYNVMKGECITRLILTDVNDGLNKLWSTKNNIFYFDNKRPTIKSTKDHLVLPVFILKIFVKLCQNVTLAYSLFNTVKIMGM